MRKTIVLENIRSAWNVGSIMRTCDAMGFDVIFIGYTPRPVGKTKEMIKKTAIGAEETLHWEGYTQSIEVFTQYQDALHLGIEISESSSDLFTFLRNSETLQVVTEAEHICLWFGNELYGLQNDTTNMCAYELHLPMFGGKESLNIATTVSAAGYVLLEKLI